jgi:tetratricopeptide (TPR) repeat protein
MATKTKTAGSTNSTPEKNMSGMFSEALDLMDQKQHDKAIVALEAVRIEAGKLGMISMARSAKNYILALQALTQKPEEASANPELDAQLSLNRGAVDEALALLDKALKQHDQDARLFYLKATAHAQKDEAEAAAEALRQAVSLNQDFLHQFRLERDFDRVRSSASFVALGLE